MNAARDLHPNQGRLEDPSIRPPLIHDLAVEGASYSTLARRYGVTWQAVQSFARRHDEEIAAAAIAEPGWVAGKRATLAECRRLVGEVEKLVNAGRVDGVGTRLERLRAAATDLGSYSARPQRQACA
jgi:phosphoglycolate phosphatase-like HAD superfamily hydrolase